VAYSTSTGLGVTQNSTPSEAISKVDAWIDTYLLDSPPALGLGAATPAVESLIVTWVNPLQKKLAFTTDYLPKITTLKADIVPSANNMAQNWAHSSKWTVTIQTPVAVPTALALCCYRNTWRTRPTKTRTVAERAYRRCHIFGCYARKSHCHSGGT